MMPIQEDWPEPDMALEESIQEADECCDMRAYPSQKVVGGSEETADPREFVDKTAVEVDKASRSRLAGSGTEQTSLVEIDLTTTPQDRLRNINNGADFESEGRGFRRTISRAFRRLKGVSSQGADQDSLAGRYHLSENVYFAKGGIMEDSSYRIAFFDTCSPRNLVRREFLQGLEPEIRPYTGRKILGLGRYFKPTGTTTLKFKFKGQNEVYVVDVHILPRWLKPEWECLIGKPTLDGMGFELKNERGFTIGSTRVQ